MNKTSRDELATEVFEELVTFIRNGTINRDHVAQTLSFNELDIRDFDRLKRIHFVLYPEVISYVEKLPERLRNVKRENAREQHLQRHVSGSIDWSATTKMRYSDNFGDSSVFICDSPYLEYDVPENILLKKLLQVIYTTIVEELRYINYTSERSDEHLVWEAKQMSEMETIFEQNIHLDRIREVQDIDITGRHLEAARQSRQPLYNRAYDLFTIYDDLMRNRFDAKAGEVLKNTLITPDQTHQLFELFVVFKLLRQIQIDEGFVLQPLETGSQLLAQAESKDTRIDVYHDDTGSLQFKETIKQQDETAIARSDFLTRHATAADDYADFSEKLVNERKLMTLYNGRPDIIIEMYRTDGAERLTAVLIGEIKYTNNKQTFLTGLEQLIEYLNYCRKDMEYLKESETSIIGVLATDGFEPIVDRSGSIVHYNTADLKQDSATHLFGYLNH